MRQHTVQQNADVKDRGTRKRMRIAGTIVFALLVWAGFTIWGQVQKFQERSERVGKLDAKLAETKKLNEALKRELDRWNDPEYREEKGRNDLHLSKPGETIFEVPRTGQ